MFNKVYTKFVKHIEEFDLITKDTKKIVIATSGGKDANIMTELLYRYKMEFRADLELVLANAAIPKWKYNPTEFIKNIDDEKIIKALEDESVYIEKHKEYWESKGISTVYLEHSEGDGDDAIFNSSIPCTHCFVAQKKALFRYMEGLEDAEHCRLAIGITKWDILYLALSNILRANGKTWKDIKRDEPARYEMYCQHFATFSPIPKINIGIPNKTVYCIEPIVCLSDMETREYAKTLELPIIPDVCVSLFGEKFSSDKRFFDNFMKVTAIEECNIAQNNQAIELNLLDPLYSNYSDILALLDKTEIMPPFEDFDGILYKSYMDEVMKAGVVD
ncbi:hypothetical protein E5329_23345 [Petralouisia muris]|uniref:Uncharacterized protein n=1 Tax=Petralouisia muris TaxID=3032872 RepID=A0AC61RQ93_9FIRM|nr:hypothetical protein [Petralouisia muris]TGY90979.1 hypothetical protein E5329_23345 [Petralouisia muris]